MRKALICLICVICGCVSAFAQDGSDDPFPPPYVAPDQTRVGDYVSTGSVELGWRFTALDGSRDAYRSVLDLPRGPHLAFSRVELRSPDNTGRVFDDLVVEGEGGGGEPSTTFRTRVAKRGLYVVDYRHSRIETFNYIPDFANPLFDNGVILAPHGWDRTRALDSVEVTIAPEHRIEGNFAFFRTRQSGLGLGTDISSDSLIFDRDLDNVGHEVRAGVTFRWPTWLFRFEQGARFYEDDERDLADRTAVTDPDALANFFRDRTTDVTAPTTRATLTAHPFEGVNLTARVVYVDYDISGSLDEVVDAVGSDPAASTIFGRDEGHAFLFDASQDVRVIDRVRVSNFVRYRRYRTVGSTQGLFTTAGDVANAVRENDDRSTRDARLEDEAQVHVDVARGLTVRAGYRFANRSFDFSRTDTLVLPPPNEAFSSVRFLPRSDDQRYDAFLAGGSYRLRHDARVYLEYENGREPNANFTLDEQTVFRDEAGDYQLLRLRGSYSPYDWLELGGSVRTTDRTFPSGVIPGRDVVVDDPLNPVFIRLFDGEPPEEQTRSRAAGFTVRVTPRSWARFGVTYDRVHNTASINYLVAKPVPDGTFTDVFRSVRYLDDESLVTADASFEPIDRLSLTAYYSLVGASGSLPLHYHQAQARGVYRFGRGVSGVLEYRLYDYDDHRYTVTDFRADHAIVGVRWEW